MLLRLIILFTAVPLVELFLLLWLADVTNSALLVFGLVIVTGIAGASLARWQGAGTLRRLQRDLTEGRVPTDALLDALMIFVAGALLLTPGILTDVVGFCLLIPPLRQLGKRALIRRVKSRLHVVTGAADRGHATPYGNDVIIESRLLDSKDEDASAQ
jgi:UPF0716 protein FxsA